MVISVAHPELLTITDEAANRSYFGGTQDWYSVEWNRRAGCGPTCAANVTAYLAFSRAGLRPLYGYDKMNFTGFAQHMEELYKFVTPGSMGLNRVEMFSDGVSAFAESRGIKLTPQVFKVPGNRAKNRADVNEFTAFAEAGLAADCPLGFLNLTNGRVKNIQSWHWITITAADIENGCATAFASDEGRQISFDLRLWYLSTRMSGGLVYFTV